MVVLGVHRSGTSAMAGALAASGFRPPKTPMPPQPENPKGYWESPVIADLNDEILAAQGASWDDMFPIDEASLLSNFGVFFLGKVADVLTAEFGEESQIVLKDPRICLLADVWKRALSSQGFRCHFVLVIRSPGEVAASLTRRNDFSRDKSLLLWLSSMISAEHKTRGESRSFVLYDDLLADPQAVLDRIETDFGRALPRRTRAAEIEVARLVDGSLRNHSHGDRSSRRGELNGLAHLAYEGLRSAARDGDLDLEMFDGLRRRLTEIEDIAGGVVSELRMHAHHLNAHIQEARLESQAAAARIAALEPFAAQLSEEQRRNSDLVAQNSVLHAAVVEGQVDASRASFVLERHLLEGEARIATNREAFLAALATERGESAKAKSTLDETAAELAEARKFHAKIVDQLNVDLQAGRSAMGSMVADLVRVTSELEAVRRPATDLPLAAVGEQVDGLQLELNEERAVVESLHAEISMLNDAAEGAAQTPRAARAQAETLTLERTAAEARSEELSHARAEFAAEAERRHQLQKTFESMALELAAEHGRSQAAQARLTKLDEMLAERREAHDRQHAIDLDEIARLGTLVQILESRSQKFAQRLDMELDRSSALATELASVKQMLAYINTRWWWRVLARAKAVIG